MAEAAGIPKIMRAFGFKAVLFSMFSFDYASQDRLLKESVYRVYGDIQIQGHMSMAKQRYTDLKSGKPQ